MDIIKAILNCLTGDKDDVENYVINEKIYASSFASSASPTEEDLADEILNILFTAEKPGRKLERRLQDAVHTSGWYEGLAKRILNGIVEGLKSGAPMGTAIKDAYNRALTKAEEFTEEHPVFTAAMLTVVAIGILVILVPWAVEALGFGELGPVEGEISTSRCTLRTASLPDPAVRM